jgi:hypothetical protein
LLDRAGLVALWREGLLAQKVLLGETKGYRFHPQLKRFQKRPDPLAAIGAFLRGVAEEAEVRGYRFDASKIVEKKRRVWMRVTVGQLEYECGHLSAKLRRRDPERLGALRGTRLRPHPMMRVVEGGVEEWEVGARTSAGASAGKSPGAADLRVRATTGTI